MAGHDGGELKFFDALPEGLRRHLSASPVNFSARQVFLWFGRGMTVQEIKEHLTRIEAEIVREAALESYGPHHPQATP